MRSKTFAVGSIAILFILTGLLSWAGMAQNQMQARGTAQSAAVIPHTDVITLTGTVTGVSLGPGQGMPTITLQSNLGAVTVMVGPYRVLADTKFEIKQGQTLEIKAFPDPRIPNAYVATEIKDASGATVIIRSAAGMPHQGRGAMGMRGGAGMGMGMMRGAGFMQGRGACPGCPNINLEAKTSLAGIVQSVDMAPGQGFPNFTLLVGDQVFTVVAGPFWLLQQTNFQISKGDSLSVVAYPSLQHDGAYVAATIDNLTTRKTIKLRDENGLPIGTQGASPMRGLRR